jgi:hypothetical protein
MTYKKGLLFIQQKSSRMFLLAFLVSLTIWFLINLSKKYEKNVTVHVSYTNLEKGTFVKSADSILKVKIKGTGFSLMSHKLTALNLDINTQGTQGTEGSWEWETENSELNELFSKSITVVNVTPKTLFFKVKKLSNKKVPIISQLKVTPKLGYGITTYSLSKDSIVIYGDESSIDSISAIKTKPLIFENSTESIKGNIALDYGERAIQIHNKEVAYSYKIERFTQGDFSVTIKIKNPTEDKRVTIFPKEAHVQFHVPLSQFNEYNAEDFSVFVDLNEINETNTLPIHIEYVPKDVMHARVLKNSVTYLMSEK